MINISETWIDIEYTQKVVKDVVDEYLEMIETKKSYFHESE